MTPSDIQQALYKPIISGNKKKKIVYCGTINVTVQKSKKTNNRRRNEKIDYKS